MRTWSRFVLAVLAGVLVACSGDDGGVTGEAGAPGTTGPAVAVAPAEVFDRAADATAAAPSSQLRTEWSDTPGTTLVEGVVHPARSALAVTVTTQRGPGVYASGSSEAPSDVVVLDRTWFVRGGRAASIAGATGRTPSANEWLQVDLAAVGPDNRWVRTPDHTSLLSLLRAVDTVPENVGREELRGSPTVHWRAAITPRALAAGLGAGAIGGLSVPEVADLTIVAFDVWVDGTGVVRKAEYRVDLAAGGPAAAALDSIRRSLIGSPSRTWELWDVGTAPTVERPASATDVTTALTAPPGRTG